MRFRLTLAMLLGALSASSSADAQYGYGAECTEARDQASSAASDLALYAARLQRCASNEDFSDDCYLEFRRVRAAYDSYASAASEVGSSCD